MHGNHGYCIGIPNSEKISLIDYFNLKELGVLQLKLPMLISCL